MSQTLCINPATGKPKVAYKTRARAEKAARRTKSGLALRVYHCRAGHWHLTSQEAHHKKEAIPSSAKLRRIVENLGRELRADTRRIEAEEKALAARKERAMAEAASIERAESELRRAIQIMTDRVLGPVREKP